MPEEFFILAVLGIIFIGFPATIFHYITMWRKQKTLQPDDERMLEDLWGSARAMERRIESLESIIDGEGARSDGPDPNLRDDVYRKN